MLEYNEMGDYEKKHDCEIDFKFVDKTYKQGECYSMNADDIHSIYFSKGTQVLFFEGEERTKTTSILEPVVNNDVIPTFEVKPWMFKKLAFGNN